MIFSLKISTTGVLLLTNSVGTQIGSNGSTLSTGIWYRICVSYAITNSTTNEIRVFVDESSSISVTNGTSVPTGSADVSIGWLGSPGANKIMNFDDIYIDNSSALTDTGNIRVTAKLPNAENVNNFDTAIGNVRGTSDFNNVNERALSETNGWQQAGNTNVVENYGIQDAATGDVDITDATLVARIAWIWAKEGGAGGGTGEAMFNNGTEIGISLLTTSSLFTDIVDSSTYPSDVAAVGLRSTGGSRDTFLYECGMIISYIPAVVASTFLPRLSLMGVG